MLKLHLLLAFLFAAIAKAEWRHGPRSARHSSLNALIAAQSPQPGFPGIYNATFEQMVDHSDLSLGTFSQQYCQWLRFISLMTNTSIIGVLAEQVGGAVLLLEHRYWGNSSPYQVLSTENMQYLTLNNSILDLTYFADNVQLPFAEDGGSNADSAPWVLIGGSYSGALTAWTAQLAPGTFWAYLATSAVVEALSNFWTFYQQIEWGMRPNCSSDIALVIDYMDNVFENGNASAQAELKEMFGLEDLEHNDDVMYALANGPALWQNPPNIPDGFYEFCDYVENSVNQTDASLLPGAEGVGLTKALQGYAEWMTTVWNPSYCFDTYLYEDFNTTGNVQCYDSYNASNPIFTDMSLSNTADRQWEWYLCNQPFGWWQTGAPVGQPTIASRLLTADYFIRQCPLYFPTGPQGQTFGLNNGVTEADTNAYTGGWFIDNTTRMIYTNGQYDPWRDVTVSSLYRPGGPLASTAQVPVNIVPEGNHCSDLFIANGESNPGCAAVQQEEYSQLTAWLNEWPGQQGGSGWNSWPKEKSASRFFRS